MISWIKIQSKALQIILFTICSLVRIIWRVKKPIAGIIIALVLGMLALIWCGAVLFHTLYGAPSASQVAILQTFPGFQIITLLGLSFALMGNTALIIGACMSYSDHTAGVKVVRVTSYLMIAATVILSAISYLGVTGSQAWPTVDPAVKGGLTGGLVGGMIGAFIQWGLLLYCFRKVVNSGATQSGEAKSINISTDSFYEEVAREMQENPLNSGLWTKAFSEVEGDEAKARALYVKYRVAQLVHEANENWGRDQEAARKELRQRQLLVKKSFKSELANSFFRLCWGILAGIFGLAAIILVFLIFGAANWAESLVACVFLLIFGVSTYFSMKKAFD